jgi:membrane associated rhomboid family serine protease
MIPIGDSPRSRTTPYVNYALIVLNLMVFVYMLSLSIGQQPMTRAEERAAVVEQTEGVCYGFQAPPEDINRFICRWGFQPGEWFDALRFQHDAPGVGAGQVLLTILTAAFLHAGWLHIGGNMLFLWVFGDNIEDRLGHFRYLLFYLAGAVVAGLAQAAVDTSELIPNVGASGAVAAVLGSYLILHPKARVNVVIPFFVLIFVPIPVPAVVMIGLWFLQNVLSGWAAITDAAAATEGGVAWWAHIGGFVFGMLMTVFFFRRRRAAPKWKEA